MRVETYSHPGRHVAPSAPDDLPIRARREGKDREADVCLIVEGAYPHVSGGVSTWVHGLIRRRPDLRFCVVAILPEPPAPVAKYAGLPNLDALHHLYLSELHGDGGWRRPRSFDQVEFDKAVDIFLSAGGLAELTKIIRLLAPLIKARRTAELLDSTLAWNLVCDLYDREMPHESFLHFFWAWRALFGGLIATLSFPLPPARVYHTVSTGYAGLLAARASVETGRPAIITEHGIYTNERRIEILQADWIVDTVDKGFAIADPRRDLRDFWSAAFESYARACYEACAEIITLHGANQPAQTLHGAAPARMKIIPNGVDYQALSRLPQASWDDPPTIALIGRVVPIKDIKTYLQAIALLRGEFPDLLALVMGPTDEQGVQGAGGGTGLVRGRPFHGPGQCRALFSLHSHQRPDQRERGAAIERAGSGRGGRSDGGNGCGCVPGDPVRPARRTSGSRRRRHAHRCRLAGADRGGDRCAVARS